MTRRLVPLLLCLLMPVLLTAQQPLQPKAKFFSLPQEIGPDDYLQGGLIIKFKPEFRDQQTRERYWPGLTDLLLDELDVEKIGRAFPHVGPPETEVNALGQPMADLSTIYFLKYKGSQDIETAVNLFLSHPAIEYAEPVYRIEFLYNPNDPDTFRQYYIDQIQARDAWDVSKGDSTVVIGIVDTGTSFSHPELSGKHTLNMADTIDGIDNDNDGYVDNYRGWDFGGDFFQSQGDNDPQWVGGVGTDHGVIVSGPAVANTDNGIGIASIGFNCKMIAAKVNVNANTYVAWGYQGVQYVADHGAQIINMSWGGTIPTRFGHDVIKYAAINKGCLLIAAGGNTPTDVRFYPATYPEVIGVSGTQENDQVWLSSTTFGTSYNYLLDICAPSRNVRTTVSNSGQGWGSVGTGTSLGAPIVAGAAGLVAAVNPTMNMTQIGERVRMGADISVYSNFSAAYTEKMGRGQVNAYHALVDTTPSVRLLDVVLDNGKGSPLANGDTVEVRARFVNYLNPVSNLQVTLSSPNTQIQVLHGDVFLGDLGTMDTASNRYAPFRFVLNGAGSNFRGYLKFSFQGNPGYDDYEYSLVESGIGFVLADQNRIELSLDGKGRMGNHSYPNFYGNYLAIDGLAGTYMIEGGFMAGTSGAKLVNNFRAPGGNSQDNDFVSQASPSRSAPGQYSDMETHVRFDDSNGSFSRLNLDISQTSYQYDETPDDNYIIMEYTLRNTSGAAINDLYAGIYSDWDLGWWERNYSIYDTATRSVFFHEGVAFTPPHHVGWSLLTNDSMRAYTTSELTYGFTDNDKFTALSSPPQGANSDTTDIVAFLGTGPFTIAAGDSHTVAFAIIGGRNPQDIRNAASEAREKYWCVIREQMAPQTELGADILDCGGPGSHVLDAGSGYTSYNWSTGATTQTITVNASGDYSVTVTNAAGCEDYDKIKVTIAPGMRNQGFTIQPSGTILPGQTVSFEDQTVGATEWGWDFGDGSGTCPVQPQATHVFSNPGTYQVRLIVSDWTCTDTIYQTLTVDTLVGISDPLPGADLSWTLFPNPAQNQVWLEGTLERGGTVTANLYDLFGRKVLSQPLGNLTPGSDFRTRIELPGLSEGIYLFRLEGQGWQESQRLQLRR